MIEIKAAFGCGDALRYCSDNIPETGFALIGFVDGSHHIAAVVGGQIIDSFSSTDYLTVRYYALGE